MPRELTRRDLLAGVLGAPLAAVACRRPRRVPDGEIAFRPEELGHALRDARPPELAPERFTPVGTVIVGAGVAGLSAARRLLSAGYEDFVVLELESRAGGTARSGANATSAYPWGAHYITAPMRHNVELVAFLRELGLVEGEDRAGEPVFGESVLCREPQERVFARGAWREGLYAHDGETDDERAQLARFRATIDRYAGLVDARGRRAFSVPARLGSDDAELAALDDLTMAEWMDREGLTSPRLRWLVDYACRDDFGARATQTSAWAGMHYYASRLLGPGREAQPILTWPEGNGFFVERLLHRVRPKLRTGLAVADILPTADGEVRVTAVGRPPEIAGYRAKRVVFAAPQMVARVVVRPYRDAPPPHLARFAYGAWMVANITLASRPRARGRADMLAWDNVLEDSPSLGYVVATHQAARDHGPTVLTYYLPLCDDDPREARKRLYAAGRDEWADVALADLERAHPDIRALATRVDVVRWGHAILRPSPGFFFRNGTREAAARPFRGIHFAHTDLSGLALFEEAFFHGTRAADEVLASWRSG